MTRRSIVSLIVITAGLAPALAASPDIHVVAEAGRTYRDTTRSSVNEYWLAPGKVYRKVEDAIWITRRDLGLEWMVMLKEKAYVERKLALPPAAKPAAAPDIHSLGWDYSPGRFAWSLKSTGETRDVAGIACQGAVAAGSADYSGIEVRLWLAPLSVPGGAELRALMIDNLAGDPTRGSLAELLESLKDKVPLERVETIDNPIAPVIVNTTKVLKLEATAAPEGIYELPPGFAKAGPGSAPAARPAAFALPAAAALELKRLEETYRVLDFAAARIWPGWTGYKETPFLLQFENNLKVLVGHPNPPRGFEPLPGVRVAGLKVYVDRRTMTSLELKPPLSGGGGIAAYGEAGGQPVRIVDMRYRRAASEPAKGGAASPPRSEATISTYLHELFHCYQEEAVRIAYGNLRYNADANYALYSAVEGLALQKAYAATDAAGTRAYIKDFLLARERKRRSMTASQQKEESSDDVREGTAVYAQVRALEILRTGFRPGLTAEEDRDYGGFRDIDGLLKTFTDRLKTSTDDVYESKMKCYDYGCFQALLLERLDPGGWQAPFAKEPRLLDEELGKRAPVDESDRKGADERFERLYGLKALRAKAAKAMAERDAAYERAAAAKGLPFIVSFKEVQEYVTGLPDKALPVYRLGLITVYPKGVGRLAFDEVSIDVHHQPVVIDQLYHLKIVDPGAAKRPKPFDLRFAGREGADTYLEAVVETPLFTLKAPKIRIREEDGRIKIWVLARVKA